MPGARIPRLPSLQLIIPPSLECQFRGLARQSFPKETLAYLLGYDLGARLEITRLWVPGPELMTATLNSVTLEDHIDWEACQAARDEDPDLCVLGDLHSHPFRRDDVLHCRRANLQPSAAPSDVDWHHRSGLRWITGICLITEGPAGRLTTRFRYWGPLPRVEIL